LTKINYAVRVAGRPGPDWLGAAEAAQRLGVKTATLYAYVSRGVLARRKAADGRSVFDPGEVERLARRGRPRGPRPSSELIVESSITALGDDRPYYRGLDAVELAESWPFERVARWLWTGPPDGAADGEADNDAAPGPWRASTEAVAAGRAAQSGLPDDVLPLERLQVIIPALAAADPLRLTLDQSTVVLIGQSLIAGMVDCLPGESAGHTIAARLWDKLTPLPATAAPGLVDALRAALVLLADHELAASTLAARVAASVRADPYGVVSTGLGVVGGPLHGGASLAAEAMLTEAVGAGEAGQRDTAGGAGPHDTAGEAHQAVGRRLRRGDRIPGLGHTVYKSADRRAWALMERIRAAGPDHPRLAVADAVLAESHRRRLPGPNVEFALAVLASVAGMVAGAGEAIFAVARTAGWLAHAMEEYTQATPVRLRAVYIGR
jgi:citrate synthase